MGDRKREDDSAGEAELVELGSVRGKALVEDVRGKALVEDREPPVVARLVVEIRSDGTRTIARGAMEDVVRGERTAIEARGDNPLSLALALARSLTQLPRLAARSAVRGLLGRGKPR